MLFSGFTPRFFISFIYMCVLHSHKDNKHVPRVLQIRNLLRFFHQLKWWTCWAVWEQQRGRAAVRESSPLPSPHAGFKQGTCRTFLTNGLIYAAIVIFSSGYSFHMDFFLSPCSIQKQVLLTVFCISWYEICLFKTVLGAALSYYGPPTELYLAGLHVKTSEPLIYVIGSVFWQTAQRKAYLFFKMQYIDAFQTTFSSSLTIYLLFFRKYDYAFLLLFIFTFGICI